jgi:hypothetical protein
MSIQVETVTLPSFLASALINGDESGLEERDEPVLQDVLNWLEKSRLYVIDVARDEDGNAEDPRFTWSYKLYFGDAEGGEVLDYVCAKAEEV